MNRKERRAIAQGKGRIKPMIEITDADSAIDYSWNLFRGDIAYRIFLNLGRLFISHQLMYSDIRDDFSDDPCLYY